MWHGSRAVGVSVEPPQEIEMRELAAEELAQTRRWSRASLVGAAHLVRALYRAAAKDDLAGEAAKMAYFFFLSLFPLLLVVFTLTGIIGGDAAFQRIASAGRTAVPDYAWQFVRELIREVTERSRPGILSFGVVLTVWAASNGVAALTTGLNTIYDVRESRSWWKRRLLALAVLLAAVLLVVIAATLLIPGQRWLRGHGFAAVWNVLQWPLALGILTAAAWLAYRFLPAREQRDGGMEAVVGALVASGLWVLATLLFRLYIANFSRYARVYGAVGAVIVLLIWFYIAALSLLMGAELAATLRHGVKRPSPHT
jgi:membrane protein